MINIVAALFAILLFAEAVPLQAAAGAGTPEPSDLALFGLGLLGVLVGRQGVAPPRRD